MTTTTSRAPIDPVGVDLTTILRTLKLSGLKDTPRCASPRPATARSSSARSGSARRIWPPRWATSRSAGA